MWGRSQAASSRARTAARRGRKKGIEGFTVRALVRDPTPPATIYAGVENDPAALTGGVFSTQDGGDTWTPVGDATLTNKKVQSLALDRLGLAAGQPATLYAGTRQENPVSGGVFMWNGSTLDPGQQRVDGPARRVQQLPPARAGARHRTRGLPERSTPEPRAPECTSPPMGARAGPGTPKHFIP